MEEDKTIRNFYKPVQPTVKTESRQVAYREVQPEKEIEPLVYCFWQLKTHSPLVQPFVYRVVSDGCIDIFFNQQKPEENFVMGFCRKYTEFAIGTTFNYIGIRFLPSAFPLLFGINAKTLSNQSTELKKVLPDFSNWIQQQINSTQAFVKVIELLNAKLKSLIKAQSFNMDQRFYNALVLIFENKGFLDTEKDLHTGLSPRQLRRIFNYYIGTTPKAFSNVVRFQQILNADPSKKSLKKNKIYFDVGFFDQAHFIKHFKTFYGVTPSEALE